MRKIMLNGQWELAEAGNDRLCEVQVPGSVLSGLYGAGKIEDPFYRTNEDVTRELFRKDYEFSRTFVAAEDILKEEKIILVCEGLDTLADIYINGQKAGSADNMHRTWKLDVKEFLHSGRIRSGSYSGRYSSISKLMSMKIIKRSTMFPAVE